MGYIYKITNDFDNKIYVGKTTRSVTTRFKEHYNKTSGCNSYIDNDMANKGIEHFSYEILEECDNDILSEREKYWINYYHCYIKDPLCNNNGYNLTPGGDGISLTEENIKKIRELWENGKTISEISQELKICHSTVYHRIASYEDFNSQENKKRAFKHLCKPIDQYDIEGRFLKTYNSLSEAARELNISKTSQIKNAIEQHIICFNYRWSYHNEPLIIKTNKKKVAKINPKTNEIIEIYSGAREAARNMNVNSSCIIKACNGQIKTSKGYVWRYIDE